MKPTPRDLMVARAMRDACVDAYIVNRESFTDDNVTALLKSLPEPAEQGQAAQDVECLRRRVEELERQIERDAHAHHQSCFDGCETLLSEDRSAVDAIRAEQRSWVKLDLLWEHRELLLTLADVAFERCRMPIERREADIAAARAEGARAAFDAVEEVIARTSTAYSSGAVYLAAVKKIRAAQEDS